MVYLDEKGFTHTHTKSIKAGVGGGGEGQVEGRLRGKGTRMVGGGAGKGDRGGPLYKHAQAAIHKYACTDMYQQSHWCVETQEPWERRGGRPGLPVPHNSLYSLCGRKATVNFNSNCDVYWKGSLCCVCSGREDAETGVQGSRNQLPQVSDHAASKRRTGSVASWVSRLAHLR